MRAVLDPDQLREDEMKSFPLQAESREAQALIAMPNGTGVAWMLLTHRKQFVHNTIARVTVMTDARHLHSNKAEGEGPHLCFELVDAGESE